MGLGVLLFCPFFSAEGPFLLTVIGSLRKKLRSGRVLPERLSGSEDGELCSRGGSKVVLGSVQGPDDHRHFWVPQPYEMLKFLLNYLEEIWR